MALPFTCEVEEQDGSESVSDDAVQLGLVAVFNGLCHVIRLLAKRGLATPRELERLHDAMATPLDDADHRDDLCVAGFRGMTDDVLSRAQMLVRTGLRLDEGE